MASKVLSFSNTFKSTGAESGWRPPVADVAALRIAVQDGVPTSVRLPVSTASGFTVAPKLQAGFLSADVVQPVLLAPPSILTSGAPLPSFTQTPESAWRPNYTDQILQSHASKIHVPDRKSTGSHVNAPSKDTIRRENSALQNVSSNTTTTTTNGSLNSFFGGKRSINGWLKQNWGKVTAIVIMLIVTTIFVVRLVFIARNKKKQQVIAERAKSVKNPEWESFFQTENSNSQQPGTHVVGHPPGMNQPVNQPGITPQIINQYPFLNSTFRPNATSQSSPQLNTPSSHQHQPLRPPSLPTTQLPFRPQPPPFSTIQQPLPDLSGLTPLPPLPATLDPEPQHQNRSKPQAEMNANAAHQGGRGMQQRFAPPETMHAGVSMSGSMLPESTRPVRETSSDATFTVSAGDIPVVATQESDAPLSKKANAAGSSNASALATENNSSANTSSNRNDAAQQQDTS